MSKVMDSKTFSEKLYNTLPAMYHNADSMVDYALKRYLQVLSDGGYSFVVDELNGILNLNDPERTPSEVLGVLFEQYGLPLFNGIPEVYLRKLLPILGDLYARKGATTVIEYLTSIISDVKTDIVISPDFLNDYHVDLRLEMDYDQTGARDLPDREQLLRIIKEFLPFFIEVTIIFVYLFYETAKLQARERLEDFVTEVRSEHSRLLSGNKEGLFPTLNNFDLGLNNSIYLNESYYYNVEVDKFWDKINYILQETGNLDRRKSNQYLRPTLNNQFKLLNEDLVLNDYIDTDELVATNINTAPMLDIGRLRVIEVIMDSMKYICEEQATISSNGDLSVDVVGLTDDTSLGSEYTHRKESLVIGEQRFYASLNTGFTFNKDLLTNEGHVDIGNLAGEDLEEHTIKNNVQETSSVENEHDTEIMAFLNTSICVLNTMILNNIPEYVKITINGETQVKYPTMFGLM